MSKIKEILAWCKQNYIPVVCIGVALASFGVFGWGWSKSSSFKASLESRSGELSKITGLQNTQVTVPAPRVSDPALVESTVVNRPRIEALSRIYQDIEGEYDGVDGFIVRFNRDGPEVTPEAGGEPQYPYAHKPMMEGLFPEPVDAENTPFDAQKAYIKALNEAYDRLHAGQPWTKAEIDAKVTTQRELIELGRIPKVVGGLRGQELDAANEKIAASLKRSIQERANKIHMYAPKIDLVAGVDSNQRSGGPFPVMEWAWVGSPAPKTETMWEGQLQAWIIRDIVESLRLANRADEEGTSVIDAPIKELIKIEVLPRYIGLDAGKDAEKVLTEQEFNDAKKRGIPRDPKWHITGRICNPIYDVRHAKVTMIVDYSRLHEVFNAFSQVNFMTVLGVEELKDHDDYKAFKEGYFFGESVDTWKVTLRIETIWMRQWTAGTMFVTAKEAEEKKLPYEEGYMPYSARMRLKIPTRDMDTARVKLQMDDSLHR